MTVVCRAQGRRTETPNAVMTTLASPTLGGCGHSVWRVEMRPGQAGPAHSFDAEQVWAVLAGAATVQLGEDEHAVQPGDAIVMPAGVPRRVVADGGLTAIVCAPAGARAALADGTDRGVPPWIA